MYINVPSFQQNHSGLFLDSSLLSLAVILFRLFETEIKQHVWICCLCEEHQRGWGVVSCSQSCSLSEERLVGQPEGAALHPAKGGFK